MLEPMPELIPGVVDIGDEGVTEEEPPVRIGPASPPPEVDAEGPTTVVVIVDMTVVLIYVLVMYVVGALLIMTVFPFPQRLTIDEAD